MTVTRKRGSCGPLGNFDLDESPSALPISEQIINALTANAGKVLDLFRSWDVNGDGKVTRKEFHTSMKKLGLEVPKLVIDNVFDGWDKDGGGELSLPELTTTLRAAATISKNIALLKKTVHKGDYQSNALFNSMDGDADGEVSKLEFRSGVRAIQGFERMPPEQIDAIFDSFDRDGGGTISFQELHRILRRDVSEEELTRRKKAEEERIARELAARVELVDLATLRLSVAEKLKRDVAGVPRSDLSPPKLNTALAEETSSLATSSDILRDKAPAETGMAGLTQRPTTSPGSTRSRAQERELLHMHLRLRGTGLPTSKLMPSWSSPILDTVSRRQMSRGELPVLRHGQPHHFDALESSARPPAHIEVLSIHRIRSFAPARRHARVLLPSKFGVPLEQARRKVRLDSRASRELALHHSTASRASTSASLRHPPPG